MRGINDWRAAHQRRAKDNLEPVPLTNQSNCDIHMTGLLSTKCLLPGFLMLKALLQKSKWCSYLKMESSSENKLDRGIKSLKATI